MDGYPLSSIPAHSIALRPGNFRLAALPANPARPSLAARPTSPASAPVASGDRGGVYPEQQLRLSDHGQGTYSSPQLSLIVRRSMRLALRRCGLYQRKRQQPSVAGLLPFLDVSSLNSAVAQAIALFLPCAGRLRGGALSHAL